MTGPTTGTGRPGDAPDVLRLIWRGTRLQILGRLWGGVTTFFALYVLAHHLTPAGFGLYTYYLAIFVLLDSLTDLGTGNMVVQLTANDSKSMHAVLAAARRIRLRTATLGAVLIGGGAFLSGEPGARWIALAALYPLTHALELPAVVYKNRISWGVPVGIRALVQTLRLGLVLFFVHSGYTDPALYLLATAAGSALANFLLHLFSSLLIEKPEGKVKPASGMFRLTLPLGLAGLCQQAYFYIDNLFVRAIEGEEALGHYNVCVRMLSYSIMLAIFATSTALPWFTRLHARGRLSTAVSSIGQPLFAFSGLLAGVVLPWTEPLLAIFGPGFVEAAASLRWLLGATVMIHAGSVLMTAVIATGDTHSVLGIAAGGLIVNLIGNAWCVPRYGIEGAAMATLVTEGFVAMAASIVLAFKGVLLLSGHRGWLWFGGPFLFVAGASISALLPLA